MAGIMWKVTSRRGVVYVEGKEAAERVMAAVGREVAPPKRGVREDSQMLGGMAVYIDRRGKPFAWLVPFEWTLSERVLAAAGG